MMKNFSRILVLALFVLSGACTTASDSTSEADTGNDDVDALINAACDKLIECNPDAELDVETCVDEITNTESIGQDFWDELGLGDGNETDTTELVADLEDDDITIDSDNVDTCVDNMVDASCDDLTDSADSDTDFNDYDEIFVLPTSVEGCSNLLTD